MSQKSTRSPKVALVVASKNKDKQKEIARLLLNVHYQVLSLWDFPECKDVVEDGKTFEANAIKKAKFYSQHTQLLVVADDSGLMIYALNGKPGVYSARFAGPGCTYLDNNRKVLKSLKGKPDSKRKAKFVSVVALYDKGKKIAVVRGECRGRIAHEMVGANGFGYDPVFIPEKSTRTFAELSPLQKNRISHRSRALAKAKAILQKLS